jgi:hypothetical protein
MRVLLRIVLVAALASGWVPISQAADGFKLRCKFVSARQSQLFCFTADFMLIHVMLLLMGRGLVSITGIKLALLPTA